MTDYRWLLYETVDDGAIAVVTLNRPEHRNPQNRGLLVELDTALLAAEADDAVRVVVLRGAGTSFSAGHDMGPVHAGEAAPGPDQHPSFRENGGTKDGIERWWRQEWKHFFTNTRRWRDLRKITVASVQGPVYSAGLMLMWACDLIVADETAVFADVVGTRLGMCGVEYFAHPWELGPRRAKELLLTGDSLSVEEAHAARDGQQGLPARPARGGHAGVRAPDRRAADRGRTDDQGSGQPDPGQPGLLQLPAGRVHAARAQPRALGGAVAGRQPDPDRGAGRARAGSRRVRCGPVDPSRP